MDTTPAPTGLLLTNLGSPDAPTPGAVRRYLAEFLSDRRVIELPRWLWLPLLHGIILRVRPPKVARAYAEVWSDDGAPLITTTRAQAAALSEQLGERYAVEIAMRYGEPSINHGLERLRARGCEKIIVLPLYPQYAGATSGTTFDAVAAALTRWRHVPALHFISDYHDHPGYLDALATSIAEARRGDASPAHLLFSFHGLPQRYADAGDPYPQQCHATARAVAERLGLHEGQWRLTFQSRFGREPWLQPYTDVTLAELPSQGITALDVVCPGFAADCLETLEEIAEEGRETFLAAGGQHFRYIPALNARPDHITALAALVDAHR